jgi:hypothetical protein
MPEPAETHTVSLTMLRTVNIGLDAGQRYGNLLTTLTELFTNGPGQPPSVMLIEADTAETVNEAARDAGKRLGVPVIIADADLGIDEIHGMEVGRIESVGDSLLRKAGESGKGLLVIDGAETIGAGTRGILTHMFAGKTLTLPGMAQPVGLDNWTVVLGTEDSTRVAAELRDRADIAIRLDGTLAPRQP